jgi:hypothetical protein
VIEIYDAAACPAQIANQAWPHQAATVDEGKIKAVAGNRAKNPGSNPWRQ